jgi:hypothetical protein
MAGLLNVTLCFPEAVNGIMDEALIYLGVVVPKSVSAGAMLKTSLVSVSEERAQQLALRVVRRRA